MNKIFDLYPEYKKTYYELIDEDKPKFLKLAFAILLRIWSRVGR